MDWHLQDYGGGRRIVGMSSGRAILKPSPNGRQIARHHHDRPHLTLHLGGCLRESIQGREGYRQPGEVTFLPAGASHELTVGPDGATTLVVEASETCHLRWPSSPRTSQFSSDTQMQLVRAMLFADVEALQELVVLLLTDDRSTRDWASPPWVEALFNQINDPYAELPPLAILANQCRVTPEHLARAFKRRFGATIAETHRAARLRAAMHALISGKDQPAHIATNLGFADQSHMTRWLRREVGFAPQRLRAAIRRTLDQ